MYSAYDRLEDYGRAIIESYKPIIAIDKGNIIAIAFTQLPLFDRLLAIGGETLKVPLVEWLWLIPLLKYRFVRTPNRLNIYLASLLV
jgi:hypothetical protein